MTNPARNAQLHTLPTHVMNHLILMLLGKMNPVVYECYNLQPRDVQPDQQQEPATELALCAVLHYSSWPQSDRRCLRLLSPPRLSALVNSCCGVRLHLMTLGVTAVPEVLAGQLSPSSSRVLFMAMFPMFVFPSFSVFSAPFLPHRLCNWDAFTHIPPQESLLYIKQTFLLPNENRIHTGILQLVLCFCLCV